jgi:hypothetical protein
MTKRILAAILAGAFALPGAFAAERADVILLNGKVVTVDSRSAASASSRSGRTQTCSSTRDRGRR